MSQHSKNCCDDQQVYLQTGTMIFKQEELQQLLAYFPFQDVELRCTLRVARGYTWHRLRAKTKQPMNLQYSELLLKYMGCDYKPAYGHICVLKPLTTGE